MILRRSAENLEGWHALRYSEGRDAFAASHALRSTSGRATPRAFWYANQQRRRSERGSQYEPAVEYDQIVAAARPVQRRPQTDGVQVDEGQFRLVVRPDSDQ